MPACLNKFRIQVLSDFLSRCKAPGLVVTLQPQTGLAIIIQKQNLGYIQLIDQHLVDPVNIAGPCDLERLHRWQIIVTKQHGGFRHLRQQTHHFMATHNMLVKITEPGPQILYIGLVI